MAQPVSGDDIQEMILRVRSIRRLPESKSPVNTAMLRMLVHKARSGGHIKGSKHYYSPHQTLQASIVKVSYSTNKHAGQWKAHGRYLEREGAQIEGERGKGFDKDDEEVSLSKTLDMWQKEGDPYFFKIIVSPQEAERLDLKDHVRRLVQRMQKDLGQDAPLQWAAIDHYNTDNPHVHIIIRAKDGNGNILSLDKNYIKQGIRHRSQEEATQKLGVPMDDDVLRRREQVITKKRLTQIDRDIFRMMDDNHQITFEGRLPRDQFQTEKRLQIIGRLQFLESMGFVRKVGVLTWEISTHMESALKAYQLSHDILKRSSRLMTHVTDPDLPLVHTLLKEGERIAGRVVGMGLHNELHDKRFILIEGIDGKVHYAHPSAEMIRVRDNKEIPNGSILYLEVKSSMKAGEKKTYLEFQNYRDMDEILRQQKVTSIDTYVAGLAAQDKTLFQDQNASTFRGKFLKMIEERWKNLEERGIRITEKSLRR